MRIRAVTEGAAQAVASLSLSPLNRAAPSTTLRAVPLATAKWRRGGQGSPRRELAQGVNHRPVLVLGADGDAERLRQAVTADGADDDALGVEIVVGPGGLLGILEADQHEVAGGGEDLEAEALDGLGQAGPPGLDQVA